MRGQVQLHRSKPEGWEVSPGAARAPLAAGGYGRRRPETTVLHEVVRTHLETFLSELREADLWLPRYVEMELRRFVSCGILEEGFCRCVCEDCGDELLVAFSCKTTGFCPSCLARRMSDTSLHLVDRVLPEAPYRQWVMAYPKRLRLAFARDPRAASESATLFVREVFRWQRRRARKKGAKAPRPGAISMTQRYGSKIELNIHHHVLVADGVFVEADGGGAGLVELEGPRQEDLEKILSRVVTKTLAMARRRGLLGAGAMDEPADGLAMLQAESMQAKLPLPFAVEEGRAQKLSAFQDGFSLEAGAHVAAIDRQGLTHLLRYALRPPIANDRLRILEDGRIELRLRRPMYDGTRAIAFTPMQFMRRLATIVPPPRQHAIRYFGVFAPASGLRCKVVKPPAKEPERVIDDGGVEAVTVGFAIDEKVQDAPEWLAPPPMPERKRRLDWAQLLSRVFEADLLTCSECGGKRKLKAFIPGGKLARQILDELGIDATAPPVLPARRKPQQGCFDLPAAGSGVDEQYPDVP